MSPSRAAALARWRAERLGRDEARVAAAELRSFYYPKQRAFFTSPHRRRATRKTRRAGASAGGCHELLARAIEHAGYRATYCNSTRAEVRSIAWESDTQNGLLDLLRRYGTPITGRATAWFRLGGVEVEVREQELALNFSNGSRIDSFAADDARAMDKVRGRAKHLFWIDEAQKFRFLGRFVYSVATPALADFEGEVWLTGTPDRDCAGLFYEVTNEEHPADGWEVHSMAVVDNPRFGATPEARWARTAAQALIDNGWTEDEPDFQREWLARWVREDARWVYAAHAVPRHELVYAPPRLAADGFPDLAAALADLPGAAEGREYFLAMGADLGTRDAFALVVWAWSLRDPVLYELASWKRTGLDYDAMAGYLRAVREQVVVGLVVADAGGGGKPAVMGWSAAWMDRYGVPIIEAIKTNKAIAINQLNTDTRRRRIRLREGSVLLEEWLAHRWAPLRSATGLPVEDPTTPNHASDAGLYAFRESYHHRYREPLPVPEVGSDAWLAAQEREHEEALDYDG